MADNPTIDNGALTDYIVSTDEGSGGHVQRVKLCLSADGSETHIDADSIGLAVKTRRDLKRISVQSGGLTTASTAYVAGDQMGTEFTITDAARTSGGTGYITGVALISAADNIGAVDVVITDSSITLAGDNAAWAISDSDALKVVAMVQLNGAYDLGNNRLAQAQNLFIPFKCDGSANLYASLITRAGHTFFGATTDLQLIVYVEWN